MNSHEYRVKTNSEDNMYKNMATHIFPGMIWKVNKANVGTRVKPKGRVLGCSLFLVVLQSRGHKTGISRCRESRKASPTKPPHTSPFSWFTQMAEYTQRWDYTVVPWYGLVRLIFYCCDFKPSGIGSSARLVEIPLHAWNATVRFSATVHLLADNVFLWCQNVRLTICKRDDVWDR